MKRLIPVLAATLIATLVSATPAGAAFGFERVDLTFTGPDGSPTIQAGSHPFAMTTVLDFNTAIDSGSGEEVAMGSPRDLVVRLPAGLAAHMGAVPACATADFLQVDINHPTSNCSDSTALGVLRTRAPGDAAGGPSPVFNLAPAPGAVGTLGLIVDATPVKLEVGVGSVPPYGFVLTLDDLPEAADFAGYELTLWGSPSSPMHDPERGACATGAGICPSSAPEVPFLTLPRSCTGPLATHFEADSWESPGTWVQAQAITHDGAKPPNPLGMAGCGKLDFGPQVSVLPTGSQAGGPTGLEVEIDVYDEGLANPNGLAQSDVKGVAIGLTGMTIDPAVAGSLARCSPTQLATETPDSLPGEGCPQASEVGVVDAETPLLGEILDGRIYAASGGDPVTEIGLYLVLRHSALGVLVKLHGRIEVDPVGDRLVATFGDALGPIPQLPLSHLGIHLDDGGPLVAPPNCGPHAIETFFTLWATPSTFKIAPSSFDVTACPPGEPSLGECGEGSCQGPASATAGQSPGLNLAAAKPKPRCPKGKRKVRRRGKVRCVPKHKRPRKQGHRRDSNGGRQSPKSR